jgi:hypothetical protein
MFKVIVRVSWKKENQHIELTGLKQLFGVYPVISKRFFRDLVLNIENRTNFFAESGFKSLSSSDNKDKTTKVYEPHDWIFVWAEDFKKRIFWLLFSRSSSEFGGKGALAAVGPPDFARFLQDSGKEAILATLTLLNNPQKMNSVAVIVSSPQEAKNAMEKQKISPELNQFKNWIGGLKATSNIQGQWFPLYKPICPVCNEQLLDVPGYNVGFTQMICPRCGYKRNEKA